MDVTHSSARTQQIMTVPMTLGADGRVQLMSKLTPASVGIHTEEDDADMMGGHYIPVNVQRVTDSLGNKVLSTDAIHGELLTHQVVDLGGAEFVQHTVPGHYYDTEDILSQEDLTEDDRRLAAALVAVQFVQQQKHQQTVLTADLLGTKPIVTTLPNVVMDKPMVTMVNSYMQSVQDAQLLDQHNQDRMLKMYQSPPQQEIKLHPLPPLKKVLSSQSIMLGNKYSSPHNEITVSHDMSEVDLSGTVPEKNCAEPIMQELSTAVPPTPLPVASTTKLQDEQDSDYDRPSHRSLPHKKRIPRKLKAPAARNIHAKCYKCNKCGETFNTQALFASHRATHNTILKRPGSVYLCELCTKQFTSQLKFFEHLKSHYEPGTFKIETPVTSETNPNLKTMEIIIKSEVNTHPAKEDMVAAASSGTAGLGLPCCVCGKTFRRQRALDSHMSTSHPRDNEIEEFSEPEDMMEGIRHVVNMNSGDEEHTVDDKFRQWRYSELGDALLHDVCMGGGSPPAASSRSKTLQCPHCERQFNHRNSLLYHVRSHSGQRPHQCDICGKGFLAASALKVHMRLHSGDKPYKCEACGKQFRQWGDLKYHVTSLHSDTKQYQCEYCGKDFARKYSLIVHRRIHTGEKNYSCEYCNKTFRASSYLQNHRRIHTGEKPHSCDICGKPFRVRSDMKRHRTTHTGEKRRHIAPQHSQESMSDVEPESILPDCSPLNLNVRSNDSDETLVYRECMERETVFLWIPTTQPAILSDE